MKNVLHYFMICITQFGCLCQNRLFCTLNYLNIRVTQGKKILKKEEEKKSISDKIHTKMPQKI